MARRIPHSSKPQKRRTTLALPVDSLIQAQRIAHKRGTNLSTVVSEALSEGLRLQATAGRAEEILEAYRKAFSGFSEDELSILDGIMLEPRERP